MAKAQGLSRMTALRIGKQYTLKPNLVETVTLNKHERKYINVFFELQKLVSPTRVCLRSYACRKIRCRIYEPVY